MITPIQHLAPLVGEPVGQKSTASEGPAFGDVFRAAVDNVRQTDADLSKAEYRLATGQLDNPASLMIAASKNEIAVSMLLQLRNKSVEAYNELMRISM